MNNTRLLIASLALGITATSACKKGDTGPSGADGNANVIYSEWQATNPWVPSTSSTGTGKSTFYYDMPAPALSQGVIDSGTVLVYAKFVSDPDGAGMVKALPSTYYNLGGASTQYRFQYGLMLNKIRVICDVLPSGSPAATNEVRYVIIPAGTATMRLSDPRSMSYRELCAAYSIPE